MAAIKDSSTKLIITEAKKRNIEVASFPDVNQNVVMLEYGEHREPIHFSCVNGTGHATFKIFLNKKLTTSFLRRADFQVPDEVFTADVKIIKDFLKKYKKVVIKPLDSVWGQGVTAGITTTKGLQKAIREAVRFNQAKKEKRILCQEHVEGREYRILVVGQKHIFAVHRVPAHVVGDGRSTVKKLITADNEKAEHDRFISVTETTKRILKEKNLNLRSVPQVDEKVQIGLVANAHAGGTVYDATDLIGKEARDTAIAIAKYFNVPVVGVDCKTPDITKTAGYILELNSTPDITLHHYPTDGESYDVAKAIVDLIFPETAKQHRNDVSDSVTA